MFCKNCGKKIENGVRSCPNCGKKREDTLVTGVPNITVLKRETKIVPDESFTVEDELRCPKCGSTNIYVNKKGYSAGGGCLGAILFGPLGLLCGQSGANKIQKTCLKCDKNFR